MLELVGTYRVISRRALVEFAFDGHPFAASRTLTSLEGRGFLEASTVARGRSGYQVFSLTASGRDLIAARRRKRRRDARRAEQRFWSGFGDTRQLAHDHRVFEAVMQDTEQLRAEGGRIRHVRLESELRGILSAAGETARVVSGPDAARVARCKAARRIGLAVFERDVPLPDALIEIEDAQGRVLVRGIEVVSSSYTRAQRLGPGAGTAYRLGAGDGHAYRAGAGTGDACRMGAGDGRAVVGAGVCGMAVRPPGGPGGAVVFSAVGHAVAPGGAWRAPPPSPGSVFAAADRGDSFRDRIYRCPGAARRAARRACCAPLMLSGAFALWALEPRRPILSYAGLTQSGAQADGTACRKRRYGPSPECGPSPRAGNPTAG